MNIGLFYFILLFRASRLWPCSRIASGRIPPQRARLIRRTSPEGPFDPTACASALASTRSTWSSAQAFPMRSFSETT
eukprot:2110319-Pyramimonas_sp.AAC.1